MLVTPTCLNTCEAIQLAKRMLTTQGGVNDTPVA